LLHKNIHMQRKDGEQMGHHISFSLSH